MIDTPPSPLDPQPLNSYNVAQLQYALSDDQKSHLIVSDVDHVHDYLQPDPALLHPHDQELDYASRRMSSSATSDSSLQSRPEKRGLSPSNSPLPKKLRPAVSLDPTAWSHPNSPEPQLTADLDDRSENIDGARVQLPSIASTFQDRHELRRASLPTLYSDSPASRLRLPYPSHRTSQSSSGLANYQFPSSPDLSDDRRTRFPPDSQLGLYPAAPDYSGLSAPASASFGLSPLSGEYARSSGLSSSYSSESDTWASGIVRPSSTPGHLAGSVKYDDSLRHSSLGGSVAQQQLFGGVTRISGHHHSPTDRSARALPSTGAIKTEADQWTFPSNDAFAMNPPSGAPSYPSPSSSAAGIPAAPSLASSPNRSPQTPASASSSLVERPPRKRGKLPKPVTDFLKDWLHRHSDHPYPSEEEKKQLCHATGLSMSQVSNWMINARRRILAPAHRAAAGPTTTTPFSSRPGPVPSSSSSVLDTGRRASMPTDSLQLYYPMSLQSIGDSHMPPSTRHMVSMTRSMSSSHATAGSLSSSGHHGHGQSPYSMDGAYSQSRMSYNGGGGGATLHPHAQSHNGNSGYMGMSMSSPPLSNPSSFLGSQPHQHQQPSLYAHGHGHGHSHGPSSHGGAYMPSPQSSTRLLTPQEDAQGAQARYTFPDTHSVSPQPGSGSGYATPQ